MHALFVHGMGRSPLSGLPLSQHLRASGVRTSSFSYLASREKFSNIRQRLCTRLSTLAEADDYVVIGHSLGGLLLRAALAELPETTPRPHRVFLLGAPAHAPRIARHLHDNALYRLLTADCGQLLASPERMQEIAPPPASNTVIIGTLGWRGRFSPFQQEANDGIIAVTEAQASWAGEEVHVPIMHTLLPVSFLVGEVIVQRLGASVKS